MKKFQAYLLIALVAIFCLASGTVAQTVQGVITGTVTDPSGASVPNATVTITNIGTNISQTAITGEDGSYRFALVPPGEYRLDVKATNFAEVRASGIVVQASQVIPFSVKLELAKGSEIIEVNEQTPLVQTATSELAMQVDHTQIENSALVDRDVFASLPFMAASVTPGIDLMPTSGGARESGTSYLLNGGDNNDNFSEGSINIHPPLESVQDFSIITNSMSAQYGRGFGAVVTANQKTGSNRIHGVVYEYNRNATLNANDAFYSRDYYNSLATDTPLSYKPKYIRNQFGGEVDGPIRKDKTFYSFAYDRYKIISGAPGANTFVPTPEAIAYITTNGSPIAKQVLAARPPVTSDQTCPSADPDGTFTGNGTNPPPPLGNGLPGYWGNGLPNPVGCLPGFFDPITDTNDTYFGRVDQNFSQNDRLSVTVNIFRELYSDAFGGGPLTTSGPVASTTTNHWHNITLNETHVFNPRTSNEFTIAHNRHFNVGAEGKGTADSVPNILVDNQTGGCLGYQIGGDFEGGQIVGFVQDRWSFKDNLTVTKGRHSIKIGAGSEYGIFYRNWDLGAPGQYEFGELTAIDGTGAVITPASDGVLQANGSIANIPAETNANFAGDYPYFQETSINPVTGKNAGAYRHYTYHDYFAFVQDDLKVSSRFTLNLGMRWERFGAPSEVNGIVAQFTNLGGCSILDPACIGAARVGPAARMWQTRNRDFAPRIGFAWDPGGKGKMAIRGGFGIGYDRIFDNIWSNGAWNPPFYALLDFQGDAGDSIFYSNPASIGTAYDTSNPIPFPGKRVSVRTMDVNMKDSSGQNFYLGIEREVLGGLLFSAKYTGDFGRHLPMLENYNRVDGIGYNSALSPIRPNALYTGFNYRANSVSSNYHALVVEAQKHMGHGLEFQVGYTFSKLLDTNSELFAGCSTLGSLTAQYYYISNTLPKLSYARGAYDHRHAFKFNYVYQIPFFKSEKGFVGHVLGGWTTAGFFQLYAGHPIDVYNGRTRVRARDAGGALVLDQNGIPFNIGGDYNLDLVLNDKPNFIGSSVNSVYSGASPADGIFTDNNRMACGGAGIPSGLSNLTGGNCPTGTVSTLFENPAYPSGSTPYLRFGALGRDVFHGPKFVQMDMSLNKDFKLTERFKLTFSAQAQNLLNHPNFDGIDSNVNSSTFGQAQYITPLGLGAPKARVMSLGLRIAF